MNELLSHLWGDYILQNHFLAVNKTSKHWVCGLHALLYTLPFLLLTLHWKVLLIIGITHFFIDRYKLAWRLTQLKNWSFSASGFPDNTPSFLSVWIIILIDNTLHLTINHFALLF